MCYGIARTRGVVDFEVDLPVEFSPSLLRVGVRHRVLVSWRQSRGTGFRTWGCASLTWWGRYDGGIISRMGRWFDGLSNNARPDTWHAQPPWRLWGNQRCVIRCRIPLGSPGAMPRWLDSGPSQMTQVQPAFSGCGGLPLR